MYICCLASESFRSSLLRSINYCTSSIEYFRMDVYPRGFPTNVFVFYIECIPFISFYPCMHGHCIMHICTWHRDSDDSLSMSHINNRVVKIRRTALKIAHDWKLEGWQCLPCKHTVNVCYRIVMTMWNEIVSQYNTRFIYRAQRRPSTTHTLKSYRINTLAATSSTLSHSQMLN